jgi:hypothetical protein
MTVYRVPEKHFFRLHHPRPRFKNHTEEVLNFVALSISDLGEIETSSFNAQLDKAIRLFPGNSGKTPKTIANWRTEISTLFSMMRSEGGFTSPTRTAKRLSENQDLIEFFRHFLLTFQYPGGHVKSHEAAEMIRNGVRFHPTSFIIDVLLAGQEITQGNNSYGISAAEATHLIFNDLRVTAHHVLSSKAIASSILDNRKRRIQYDRAGDIIRYAKDVLDYMVNADLLSYRPATDTYALKPASISAAVALRNSAELFEGYDHLYRALPTAPDVASCQLEWVDFVNRNRSIAGFEDDISEILAFESDDSTNVVDALFLEGIKKALAGNANDIGRIGEALAIAHEQNRLRSIGRADLVDRVKKIPESFAVGYDIKSFEGRIPDSVESPLYVEVKTTRSRSKNLLMSFKMTPNEWVVCERNTAYCIYRILLTPEGPSLFVIRDPHRHYVEGRLAMTPRDGAEVTYTIDCGQWEQLRLERIAS